ncbi:MAG: AAA family ATPase [Candidatus Sumerlaeota bacterium]|nr:AAA family ATPase [Candidatus Sumerlaeota bacterium]
MTQVTTFYSFKGGVGRTMALVNVAHVLARDGWRVLMVDFDLEAPGMTQFFADAVQAAVKKKKLKKDSLQLLMDTSRRYQDTNGDKKKIPLLSLQDYIVPIPLPKKWLQVKAAYSPYLQGRLDLMPATLDPEEAVSPEGPSEDYLKRIDELNLTWIFSDEGPRHRFGDYVRQHFINARFEAPGDILFTLRERVKAAYDIVLVDSRTGLNEISGLCIGPMSDGLVICLGLNKQNLEGTRYFMRKAGLFDKDKAKPYVLAIGPVPSWRSKEVQPHIKDISEKLQSKEIVEIPYHPTAALVETIFVTEEPDDPITKAYENLAPLIRQKLCLRDKLIWEDDFKEIESLRIWNKLGENIAASLPSYRQEPYINISPSKAFTFFPTAHVLTTCKTDTNGFNDEYLEQLPLTAAAAAYRLNSEQPFRLAWKIANKHRNSANYNSLAMRLVFFQCRLFGRLPDNIQIRKLYESFEEQYQRERSESPVYAYQVKSMLNFLYFAVVMSNQKIMSFLPKKARNEKILAFANMASNKEYASFLGFRVYKDALFRQHSRDWINAQLLDHSLELIYTLSFANPKFRASSKLYHCIAESTAPVLVRNFSEIPIFNSVSTGFKAIPIPRVHHIRAYSNLFGFWPEVHIAAAVAIVKGKKAVEEVISWLTLAKIVYGYAWRVLVDWRHLKNVKDHPRFIEFLKAEDEEINKIESMIDNGTYPL